VSPPTQYEFSPQIEQLTRWGVPLDASTVGMEPVTIAMFMLGPITGPPSWPVELSPQHATL